MEAVVIIIPVLIALILGAWAVLSPQRVDPVAERARLEEHIARLEESLARARAANWDEQMIANLVEKLAAARREQSALRAG
jgi:hypothetical protein